MRAGIPAMLEKLATLDGPLYLSLDLGVLDRPSPRASPIPSPAGSTPASW